jgi:drug/metabolite transporter (DMT)-like permease
MAAGPVPQAYSSPGEKTKEFRYSGRRTLLVGRHRPEQWSGCRGWVASVGVSRSLVFALYGLLVVIWSSTWVGIKIGLEDCPPLLGAGVRFTLAGAILLAVAAVQRRSLRTDRLLAAVLALAPFAFAYGLVYWGEQYVPSGLAAVLFGVLPLYTALIGAVLLPDEPLRAPLLAGVLIAIAGLALAFLESVELGAAEKAALGASALALSPLGAAVGGIAQKLRASQLDAVVLNGWGMLGGGLLLLAASGASESWGEFAWTAESVGSILYLAVFGSAIAFVTLTVLLRQISAMAMSFLAMILPFGALLFGAALYDESITARALGGAALVAAGLLIAQWSRRRRGEPVAVAA